MLQFALICSLFFYSLKSFSADFIDDNASAIKVLQIGGGLTLATLFFKHDLKHELAANVSRDRPLKGYSKIGDVLGQVVPNIAYVLAMGSDYLINHDQRSLDRTILMTKATLYSGAMTDLLKLTINERRPNGSKHSFPSGHTTTAFAFSSVVAMEHSLPWGIAANAMAAFVGFSRMNDNAHYLQDVLAGATIGTMFGVGVYYAKQKRDEKNASPTSAVMLLPTPSGLGVGYSFVF